MQVAETARLRVRWFDASDSAFIVELLNQPSWIRFIGDKGVRTHEDALHYLERGPIAMYRSAGYGLFAVELWGSNDGSLSRDEIRRDTYRARTPVCQYMKKPDFARSTASSPRPPPRF
jgi:hypothetical protein